MAAIFTEAIDRYGNYINVLEFPPKTGLRCKCICPRCGERVGSRIKKSRNSSSFFHENDEYNVLCNGGKKESDIHILAKDIFQNNNQICFPLNISAKPRC